MYIKTTPDEKLIRNICLNRTKDSTRKTMLIKVAYQNQVHLDHIVINTPESEMYGDGAITIICSTNVFVSNVDINGTYSTKSDFGYGISMRTLWNTKISKLTSTSAWGGVFGTNNMNVINLENCNINRFDIHCYGKDVRCYNCKFTDLYNQFSSVYGDVYFEKCTFSNFIPFLMESSYNAYTPFDLTFRSCTFNLTGKKNYLATLSGLEEAHNSRPELSRKALPNITIKNCTVNLAEDVKDWYLVHTGKATYKEPLDYISKIEVNRLKINGNVDYKLFSTDIRTTKRLKIIRKRVKLNKN